MTAVEGSLLALGIERLDTVHGPFDAHVLHNLTSGQPALAVVRGDPRGEAPLLSRVHSSCITSESYEACDCDCAEQLDGALAAIAAEGRGVLFYLTQDGRGAGFAAKARDRMLVQASRNRLTTFDAYTQMGLRHDQRRYEEVPAICRLLDVAAPLEVLTNNPEKLRALTDAGVAVARHRALPIAASPWSRHYLDAKSRSGHLLATNGGDAAVPPEAVEACEPAPSRAAPELLQLASYMLPLRGDPPTWFRLHLYLDTQRRRERVVLTHGRPDAVAPLVYLQPQSLLERFPLRSAPLRQRWRDVRAAMVANGAGCVLVVDDGEPLDDTAVAVLADHVGGRRARISPDTPPLLADALVRRGVELEVDSIRS